MFIFNIECILDKLGGISAKLKRAWFCIRFAQVLFLFGIRLCHYSQPVALIGLRSKNQAKLLIKLNKTHSLV
jgi:hypothetical protein